MEITTVTASATNRRILVVDDEEPILFAMKEYFSAQGYEVDCARAKQEAEALVGRLCYSVAIVDVRLSGSGGAEGLEFVEYIRGRCPETKIVVLTAYGSAEMETEALSRGSDAFLHKPVRLPEVEQIVSGLLGREPGAFRRAWRDL